MRASYSIPAAVCIAIGINLYLFSSRTDLSELAAHSVFANCFVTLTLVPLYLVLLFRGNELPLDVAARVKAGMKAITLFTLIMAAASFLLFSTWGTPLIHERMEMVRQLLEASELSIEEQTQRLATAQRIYSPAVQVLFSTLAMLMTGLISSIIGAMAVRGK